MSQHDLNSMSAVDSFKTSCYPEKRNPCYGQLSHEWQEVLNQYIETRKAEISEHHCSAIKRYCSVFMLFLQQKGVPVISDITYEHITCFIASTTGMAGKTRSQYLSAVRLFLQYLSKKNLCTYGFSLYIHFYLQDRPFLTPVMTDWQKNEIFLLKRESHDFPADEFLALIQPFDEQLSEQGYSYVSRRHATRTLLVLYLFLDMQALGYHREIVCKWFGAGKEIFQSGWKIARKVLSQFDEYVTDGGISLHNAYYKKTNFQHLPEWCRTQLSAFLELKAKEHITQETIDNYRFSIVRLCFFIEEKGITSFADLSADTLKEFNIYDRHLSTSGKNACNLRIKKFLIFLAEKGCIQNPNLYEALPNAAAVKERVVITLSDQELSEIHNFIEAAVTPGEVRDKAILLLGLKMGMRAVDVTNLKMTDINWKNPGIKFIQQKTGNELFLPMPVDVGNAIFEYLTKCRPKSESSYVFLRQMAPYTKAGKNVCRKALHHALPQRPVKGSGFHVTRKTFSTTLLNHGVKRQLIAEALGHNGTENLKKYLSLDHNRMKACPLSLKELGIPMEGGICDV